MSFIEELFYGNLDPQPSPRRSTCRVSRAVASLDELEDALTERLQGEDKRLFARLVSRLANWNLTLQLSPKIWPVSTFEKEI